VPRQPCALQVVSESAGIHGVSQVLRRSSPCMPCPDDPGRPPESHPIDSFAWASHKRKRLPPASSIVLSGLYQTSGRCGLPYGLHGSLCTLQTFRSVRRRRLSSYGSATLGTGGWLDLTRQGLTPCKKRQACLGAHAMSMSGGTALFAVSVRSIDWVRRSFHSRSDYPAKTVAAYLLVGRMNAVALPLTRQVSHSKRANKKLKLGEPSNRKCGKSESV
jgi:hypothetical protein